MKRTLAAILTVIAVVFTLASCGNTEENLLPFGLQFGCSEADFLKRLEKSGYEVEIEQANTNNGFVGSAIRMTFKECAELLPFGEIFNTEEKEPVSYDGSDRVEALQVALDNMKINERNFYIALTSHFYFSLSQNKLLYEFYWFFEDTADGEFAGELVNYFNAYFGFNGEEDSLKTTWETEELYVSIVSGGDTYTYLVVHSLEYDDVTMHGTGIGE